LLKTGKVDLYIDSSFPILGPHGLRAARTAQHRRLAGSGNWEPRRTPGAGATS
jgi:hypothetical protein